MVSETNGSALSELEKKIIKQVEHYFGDRNLMRDKFLSEKIKEDEGWVAIDCLLTFNRLKALSEDPVIVISALEKSTNQILEVNREGLKVRRSPEVKLPEKKDRAFWEEVQKKSAHVSGLPVSYSLPEVEKWLESLGFESEYIKFVREDDKKFHGEINIQFSSEEILDLFVKKVNESAPVKIDDKDVKILKLSDYMHEKNVTHSKKLEDKKKSLSKKKNNRFVFCTGRIIRIDDVSPDARAETVRTALDSLSKVDWVHFDNQKQQCFVRFVEGNMAESVVEALQGSKFEQLGEKCSFVALSGEEEKAAWEILLPKKLDTPHSNKTYDKTRKSGKVASGGIVSAAVEHKYFDDEEREKDRNEKEHCDSVENSKSNLATGKRSCPDVVTKEDDDPEIEPKTLRTE